MPLLSRARSNSMIAQKRSRVTRVVKSRISMVAKPIPRKMKERKHIAWHPVTMELSSALSRP